MCDAEIIIPTPVTARVQEMHELIIHIVCELIDEKFQ
jgi:D-sedoheptulose 7-phosphate isomerase